MIDKEKGIISVINDKNEIVNIQVILVFEIEELNKKYVVYTFDSNKDTVDIDIIISEFDQEKNEIASIDENEKEIVMEYYNSVKDNLLNS